MLLKILQNSQENTRARVSFLSTKRFWQGCFPVNFVNVLRSPFLQNTSGNYFRPVRIAAVCFNPISCQCSLVTAPKTSENSCVFNDFRGYDPVFQIVSEGMTLCVSDDFRGYEKEALALKWVAEAATGGDVL